MKPVSVLMLVANFTYPEDGRVRREASALARAGCRVTVVCPRAAGQVRREAVDGVMVRRYRLPAAGGSALSFVVEHVYATLASLAIVIRCALIHGVDVVHVHNPPDLLGFVGVAFKRLGKRFVYDHHDLAPDMYLARFGEHSSPLISSALMLLERLCCRFADLVIATNESYATSDVKRNGIPRRRITVVRNGPELDLLRPIPPDEALRQGAETVLCYVGVMGPQDGVDHLLRALCSLLQDPRHASTLCYIVGDGDAVPGLRALAASLGIDANVRFVGRVPTADVVRYVCSADICVDPAPANSYNSRSTAIKVMEYMALGRAIVAFDLPEHRVTAGPAAVFVPADDDVAFGKALAALADDPEERERLGRLGRRRVEEHLAWHRIAPRLLDAYETMLEPGPQTRRQAAGGDPSSDAAAAGGADAHLRVALVSYDYWEGCAMLANGLSGYVDATLFLPTDAMAQVRHLVAPGVRMMPFVKPRLRQPLRQWRTLRSLVRAIEALNPAIVHVQQGHLWLNLFALPRLRRRTVVLTIHDPAPHAGDAPSAKTPQAAMNLGFRLADHLMVHTESVRKQLSEQLTSTGDGIDVVPYVAAGPPSQRNGNDADEDNGRSVLFFGRIWPYKGLDQLIAAEPRISAVIPDVEIVIAGEGEDMERYRRMMAHPEQFTIHDRFISKEEVQSLFRRASLVVLPYVDATQSAVIPIAYAFEKPVVATTVGGLPEMVDHGVTGLLVPPRDCAALADAIVQLLQDPERRVRMGQAGRRKAADEWAPDVVARQTVDVYHRALARSGRSA